MQQGTKTQEDRVKVLARIPFFAPLSSASLHLLAQRLVRRHLEPGQMIFLEGQLCEGLYVIESGSVKFYKMSRNGREQVVATHGPGQTLSELPLIDGECHPFSASATAKSVLLFAGRDTLKTVCPNEPACAHEMLNIVASRLRAALGTIEELSFSTVRVRLAAYLLRAARGRSLQNGSAVQLPNNREIAADIGTVRELVSRHLGRLQTKGIIRITGRAMQVLDTDALAGEAGSVFVRARRSRASRFAIFASTRGKVSQHRPANEGHSHKCAVLAGRNTAISTPHCATHARHSA